MGGFSVRIFAQPNFENVTGIGLHTSFEEWNYHILCYKSVPEKYFWLDEFCKMSLEYVEIKYISYTTILWLS